MIPKLNQCSGLLGVKDIITKRNTFTSFQFQCEARPFQENCLLPTDAISGEYIKGTSKKICASYS